MSALLFAIAPLTLACACSGEAPERAVVPSGAGFDSAAPVDVIVRELGAGAAGALNGCTRQQAVDARDRTTVAIRFGGLLGHNFEPRCVRVREGAHLRFEGPLLVHPIAPGRVVDAIPIDAEGPVDSVGEGETAEFVIEEAGEFGFYCDLHVGEGMMGALYVESAGDRS